MPTTLPTRRPSAPRPARAALRRRRQARPGLETCERRTLMSADVRIGGSLFHDLNRDGVRDVDDAPIAGASVLLYAADGETLRGQATTAADGSYLFDDQTNLLSGHLAATDYVLVAVPPSGLAARTIDAVDVTHVLGLGTGPNTVAVRAVAAPGGASGSIDFGLVQGATLSDSIFLDDDGDNQHDPTEAPVVGEFVVLSGTADTGDAVWVYAATDETGAYAFDGLLPGVYSLRNYRTTGLIAAGSVVGQVAGSTRGATTSTDLIDGIALEPGEAATGYNFAAATTLIGGQVVRDLTGDSYDPGDMPLSGIRVNLYRDVNNSGKLDSGDGGPVAFTTTDAEGRWRFVNPGVGRVFTQQVLPSNYVRTYPLAQTFRDIHVCGCGYEQTGINFANYQKLSNNRLQNVTYTITSDNGSTRTVTNLRGNVRQDDEVRVNFTVKPGPEVELSLVSYAAPTPTFDSGNAVQQVIYRNVTQTFQPGTYSLTVEVPNSFFQVDFVYGTPIATFGPANSNIFFTPQGRLISADNGGLLVAGVSSLSGTMYLDADADGVFDLGELGLSGVEIQLVGTDYQGNEVDVTATSDGTGLYSFAGLQASDSRGYALRIVPNQAILAGYRSTAEGYDEEGGDDLIAALLLNFNQNGTGINFGWRPIA